MKPSRSSGDDDRIDAIEIQVSFMEGEVLTYYTWEEPPFLREIDAERHLPCCITFRDIHGGLVAVHTGNVDFVLAERRSLVDLDVVNNELREPPRELLTEDSAT